MLEAVKSWILGIAAASMFCALAGELTPKGPIKNYLRVLCGVVMALALISPLMKIDLSAYAINAAKYRSEAAALCLAAEEKTLSLSRRIIEEDCAAYILDKGAAMGLTLEWARVELRWSSGEKCWYPVSAEIGGAYNAALAAAIEGELGLPRDSQIWSADEKT